MPQAPKKRDPKLNSLEGKRGIPPRLDSPALNATEEITQPATSTRFSTCPRCMGFGGMGGGCPKCGGTGFTD